MSHAAKKVVIDCRAAPARLVTIGEMIICGMLKDRDAIHDFGVMGEKVEALVNEFVDEHIAE